KGRLGPRRPRCGYQGGRSRSAYATGPLAGIPPHGPGDEVVADLDLAQDLEAVALVERDVADVARLQVGAETLPVATVEDLGHQRRAQALSLLAGRGAEDEQVEVRLVVGMLGADLHQPGA